MFKSEAARGWGLMPPPRPNGRTAHLWAASIPLVYQMVNPKPLMSILHSTMNEPMSDPFAPQVVAPVAEATELTFQFPSFESVVIPQRPANAQAGVKGRRKRRRRHKKAKMKILQGAGKNSAPKATRRTTKRPLKVAPFLTDRKSVV